MFRVRLAAAVVLGVAAPLSVVAGGAAAAGPLDPVSCPAVSASGVVTPAPAPGVNWSGCDLRGADLTGADLSGADLSGADFYRVPAGGANFYRADLSSAVLVFTGLNDDILDGATLAGADIQDTQLAGADLTSANMNATNFQYSDMTGAVVTGATFVNTFWVHDTCPDGTNSDSDVHGCFSAKDVTPPTGSGYVFAGAQGAHGWYTSEVVVSWAWTDDGTINPTACGAFNDVSANGITTLTDGCADMAGNIGHTSFTVKVDTTAPTVTVTGVRNRGRYIYGSVPAPKCRTADTISGVARPAKPTVTTSGSHGAGSFTAVCSGAVSVAGTAQKAPVRAGYTVVYGFGGFLSPRPGSTVAKASRTIVAAFRLVNAAGHPISVSAARYLAAAHRIRVSLRGPGIATATANCAWDTSTRAFWCAIKRPAGIRSGAANRYIITAFENVGTGPQPVPAVGKAVNPETIHFR